MSSVNRETQTHLPTYAPPQSGSTTVPALRARAHALAIPVLFLLVSGIVFALQSDNVGFWSPGHGWTSIHGLALATHATAETGFVGYSQAFRLDDGSIAYHYFDRYPFFTSAAANLLLRVTDDLPTEIMLFRHAMNVIFLLTMVAAYRLVRLFIDNRYLAFAVTVFAFSSFRVMNYKDMIHYDQPALLLMLILTYAIARYRQGMWGKWAVFGVALAAVSVGRGYASFFPLGVWALLEVIDALFGSGRANPARSRVLNAVRHPSIWITVVAVLWAGAWLSYNVYTEARVREITLVETSVIDSAFRRLPFVGNSVAGEAQFHSSDKGLPAWREFASVQTERVVLWVLPLRLGGDMHWRFVPLEDRFEVNVPRLLTGIALFGVALAFVARTRPPLRIPAGVLAFGGVLWVYVMINLSTKHDYVTMYSLGLSLVVYTALFGWARRYPVVIGALLVLSVGLFAASANMARAAMTEEITFARQYTHDFNRIRPTINGSKNTVYLDYDFHKPYCIIDNDICFGLGYYLDDNFLTEYPDQGNYVLSPRPFYADERFVAPGATVNIVTRPTTPENDVVYLLDKSAGQTRTLPEAPEPMVHYGERIRLQSWTLDGDVTLSACTTVYVESWWYADETPSANYNMQVVMVNDVGEAVVDANAPLGRAPTSLWEPGTFVGDVRPITVPCDTPPGEYPLIMGGYHPDTLEPLPVTGTDGTPLGNQFYLTTLFVQ